MGEQGRNLVGQDGGFEDLKEPIDLLKKHIILIYDFVFNLHKILNTNYNYRYSNVNLPNVALFRRINRHFHGILDRR